MVISAALLSTPDGPSDGEMTRKALQNAFYNNPTPLPPSTSPTIAIANSSLLALLPGAISSKLQVIDAEGNQGTNENFGAVQGNEPRCSLIRRN